MALKQVEDAYAANNQSSRWLSEHGYVVTPAHRAAEFFRKRDELVAHLEAWATEIGAERELHVTEFAEKLLAEGWDK
jgi:hypothetical protein